MSIRRGLMSMAQTPMIKTGSFTPTETSSSYTIDTGSTSWTHLLVTPRIYPYAEGTARCIGLKYVNLDTMRLISAYGASGDTSITASAGSTYIVNTDSARITVNYGVVTFGGVASQVGVFVAGCVYDWYAW